MRSRELHCDNVSQCLFTMQWIHVMYSTKKIYVMFSLKCMSSGQKILRESLYRSILYRSFFFSFARFCYPLFTVSPYRESRATKVIHCITVPSLFGEFYEIFNMKTREHVRSSASW